MQKNSAVHGPAFPELHSDLERICNIQNQTHTHTPMAPWQRQVRQVAQPTTGPYSWRFSPRADRSSSPEFKKVETVGLWRHFEKLMLTGEKYPLSLVQAVCLELF